MNLFRSLLAVGFALGMFAGPVRGQDSTRFNVYLHGVLGTGLSFLSSPDIDNLMAPYEVYGGPGWNSFVGVKMGFRKIAEIEYRLDLTWDHDLWLDEKLVMDQSTVGILFGKFNPLFMLFESPNLSTFVTYGFSNNAKFLDADNNGWKEGQLRSIGLAVSWIYKSFEWGISLESRKITYKTFILGAAQADIDTKASQVMILVHVGGGFGF